MEDMPVKENADEKWSVLWITGTSLELSLKSSVTQYDNRLHVASCSFA